MSKSSFPKKRPSTHLDRQEQPDVHLGLFDRFKIFIKAIRAFHKLSRHEQQFAEKVIENSDALQLLDDDALDSQILETRKQLYLQGLNEERVITSFALIREVSRRELGMAHFPTQLAGGLVILSGRIAEMATGEGKTLVATLPAATAALAGIPVHVISANDYLTQRDSEEMQPVYNRLGLSVGYVIGGMEPPERRSAYDKDITYCTNKDVVFDYLKDLLQNGQAHHPLQLRARQLENLSPEQNLLQRGLHFAVVDEADSVLIDEARTPLIISGQGELNDDEQQALTDALDVAISLQKDLHYTLDDSLRMVELTPEGDEYLQQWAETKGGIWIGRLRREELVRQALSAIHHYKRDVHYLIDDGKILIVDEHTGRTMPDRTWSHGLHQLIEIKEQCEPTAPNKTMARISYQRLFRRYHHLGGMTGTAKEVSTELYSIYGTPVVAIPTYRPPLRQQLGCKVFITEQQKWDAVVEAIKEAHNNKRPVLVGSATVALSEELSAILEELGIVHQLLNAKQDSDEAHIVAQAGQSSAITIATNMAGRGTDIKLSNEARDHGGLHVIVTELHEAGRIDRQLVGRSARQGDPGSFEYILSLEDMLPAHQSGAMTRRLISMLPVDERGCVNGGYYYQRFLQKKLERHYAAIRANLFKSDEQQIDALAFAGRSN